MVSGLPRRGVTILGSTGSVGRSTLDVVNRHPDRFRIVALSAHRNAALLAEQCAETGAAFAVVTDAQAMDGFQELLDDHGCATRALFGPDGLKEIVALAETDAVMASIVGAAGLESALHAARCGKRLLLANKESMVIAGELLSRAAREGGAEIIPVDSEHNALFQALPPEFRGGLDSAGVVQLILTASGGPFLRRAERDLSTVTPEEACNHPNWDMGRKISVDSATLMNKGLEVIEARWLFNARPDQISVVIHPQSMVHSMVAYRDGSVLAQLGVPDMRTPIAHALAWPERIEAGVERLDLTRMEHLEFHAPDLDRFPCLRLAFEALEAGGNAPVVLNAANEVAVEAFLGHELRFTDIPVVIERTLEASNWGTIGGLEDVLEHDRMARQLATETMKNHD